MLIGLLEEASRAFGLIVELREWQTSHFCWGPTGLDVSLLALSPVGRRKAVVDSTLAVPLVLQARMILGSQVLL